VQNNKNKRTKLLNQIIKINFGHALDSDPILTINFNYDICHKKLVNSENWALK